LEAVLQKGTTESATFTVAATIACADRCKYGMGCSIFSWMLACETKWQFVSLVCRSDWCPCELRLSKFPYCLVWRDVPLTSLVSLVWSGPGGREGGLGEGGGGPLPPTVPECTTSLSFLMNTEFILCH
jgi:hypothetical protein